MTQQEYENEIKELKERLEKLEVAKIEEPQPKRWKPEYDDDYWYVDSFGFVKDTSRNTDSFDNWTMLTDNCFKTKEEAEEHKKQIEYTARYKNYIEEHSEPLDWNDKHTYRYLAKFDYDDNKVNVGYCLDWKFQGVIYASSEQVIWNAIKEIGEDNFKKYVLGVK